MYSVLEIIPQPESLCKVPRNELYITSSVRTGDLSEKQVPPAGSGIDPAVKVTFIARQRFKNASAFLPRRA